MAKKTPKAASGLQPLKAEGILALIKSLPKKDKDRAFELVSGDPENRPVGELLQLCLEAHRLFDQLWNGTKRLWGSAENASSRRGMLDEENAEKVFLELRRKVEGLQRKRGMTEANRETVNRYLELEKKHGGQWGGKMRALMELVTLPSEQGKGYVVKYKKSCHYDPEGVGDMEPVRHHIKRLRAAHRKQQVS